MDRISFRPFFDTEYLLKVDFKRKPRFLGYFLNKRVSRYYLINEVYSLYKKKNQMYTLHRRHSDGILCIEGLSHFFFLLKTLQIKNPSSLDHILDYSLNKKLFL